MHIGLKKKFMSPAHLHRSHALINIDRSLNIIIIIIFQKYIISSTCSSVLTFIGKNRNNNTTMN